MVLPFSGNPLFSSDELREDDAEIQKLRSHKDARFLPFFEYDPPITESGELFWIPWDVVQFVCENPDSAIFLGLADDHSPRFAVDIGESLEHWQNATRIVSSLFGQSQSNLPIPGLRSSRKHALSSNG